MKKATRYIKEQFVIKDENVANQIVMKLIDIGYDVEMKEFLEIGWEIKVFTPWGGKKK